MVKACFALKGVQNSEGVAVCSQLSHPLVLQTVCSVHPWCVGRAEVLGWVWLMCCV